MDAYGFRRFSIIEYVIRLFDLSSIVHAGGRLGATLPAGDDAVRFTRELGVLRLVTLRANLDRHLVNGPIRTLATPPPHPVRIGGVCRHT